MTDAGRAAEHRELYASLGYEVALVALEPSAFDPACAACAASVEQVALFTRQPAPEPRTSEPLPPGSLAPEPRTSEPLPPR